MGCGKSTIGTALSTLSRYPLYHTDTLIETQGQTSIPQIFEQHGEAHFRALEKKLCADLYRYLPCIFSTGGGTVLDPDNFQSLASVGTIFFLDTPLELILNRLEGVSDRPLYVGAKNAKALWTERHPIYTQHCNIHVHPDNRSPELLAAEIWSIYQKTEAAT